MREILFRGKRKDNGEWIKGHLIRYKDGGCGIIPSEAKVHICADNPKFIQTVCYEVIPETIGQYTGLKDKNGKKIFEGDVVEFLFNESLIRGKVFYTENDTAFCVWYRLPEQKLSINSKILCNCGDIEVIGNIHDNPELLEVTE